MSDLFHVRYGRGRPIVVIHGGLGLDHTYMRALDRMGDIAELIYIDVRGNGRSTRDRLATATLDTFADDVDALRSCARETSSRR
jgi:pimeloyl-ACP methyl ester carboxylesterase